MPRFHHRMRDRILKRDNYQCKLCTLSENLDAHHIVPQNKGGKSIEENGITLCDQCHNLIRGSDINWAELMKQPWSIFPELFPDVIFKIIFILCLTKSDVNIMSLLCRRLSNRLRSWVFRYSYAWYCCIFLFLPLSEILRRYISSINRLLC